MNARNLQWTGLQVVTAYNALYGISNLSSADKFQLGGLLRRIRGLGDYDPQCAAFRLLEPAEYDVQQHDGSPLLLPDGKPKKGYKYDAAVLLQPFPEIAISSAEEAAVVRALVAMLSREDGNIGACADLLDIASWFGVVDALHAAVAPESLR